MSTQQRKNYQKQSFVNLQGVCEKLITSRNIYRRLLIFQSKIQTIEYVALNFVNITLSQIEDLPGSTHADSPDAHTHA